MRLDRGRRSAVAASRNSSYASSSSSSANRPCVGADSPAATSASWTAGSENGPYVNRRAPLSCRLSSVRHLRDELPGSKSFKDGSQLWQEWLKRLDAVGLGSEDNHGDGQLIQILLKLDALVSGQLRARRPSGCAPAPVWREDALYPRSRLLKIRFSRCPRPVRLTQLFLLSVRKAHLERWRHGSGS